MVMIRFFIPLLCLFSALYGADVKVSVELVDSPVIEGMPVAGVIKVTHSKYDAIDNKSFKLKGDPLKVDFVEDIKLKGDNVITTYRFKLDPEARGLHLLPSIRFKVSGKEQSTTPFSFTVAEGSAGTPAAPLPNATPSPSLLLGNDSGGQSSANAIPGGQTLKLDAFAEGGPDLYPGQRAKLVYRYTYSGSIALAKEQLPMLEAKGFKKIGEKEIKDTEKGAKTVTEISQSVEATTPGDYSFGPSFVEGYGYSVNATGQRTFFQPALKSEAPPVTLKVIAFPEEGKPKSFNNALGKYTVQAKLLTPSKMEVGDILTLSLQFSGTGDLANLPLPDLCCQPGFSGKFKQSDLPPVGLVRDNSKYFVVDFKPLSTAITEVPPIEFTSFDPTTRRYETARTEAIPIQVNPSSVIPGSPTAAPAMPSTPWQQPSPTPKPVVDAQDQSVTTSDVEKTSSGKWWMLFMVPFVLLIIYKVMRKNPTPSESGAGGEVSTQAKMAAQGKKKSVDIFLEALKAQNQPANFYALMTRAFLFGLFEKKWIPTPDLAPEELPAVGISKEVRDFLFVIDEIRFSRPSEKVSNRFIEQARHLFTTMQQSIPNEPDEPVKPS